MRTISVFEAKSLLSNDEILIYPCETMYGIGCSPNSDKAILNIIALKQRDKNKGLIILADDFEKLTDYIDLSKVSKTNLQYALDKWPSHNTFLFPAKNGLNPYLTGFRDTIALRVSHDTNIRNLTQITGPITSTSANYSGFKPCLSLEDLNNQFSNKDIKVVEGRILQRGSASNIYDILTLKKIR